MNWPGFRKPVPEWCESAGVIKHLNQLHKKKKHLNRNIGGQFVWFNENRLRITVDEKLDRFA